MNEPELKWTTTHTETRMIHFFDKGYKIVVDKRINVAYKVSPDQSVTGQFETTGLLLETYREKLVEYAKSIQ